MTSKKTQTPLVQKFEEFDKENPEIYKLFEKYAIEATKKGFDRISGWFVVNVIRWMEPVKTTGDNFKIRNDFIALYVRKFIKKNPKYANLFVTKEMKRL